jgi:hypothetical protein
MRPLSASPVTLVTLLRDCVYDPMDRVTHPSLRHPAHPAPHPPLRRRPVRACVRRRREQKPRPVVLCDVSLSTRNPRPLLAPARLSAARPVRQGPHVRPRRRHCRGHGPVQGASIRRPVEEVFAGELPDADRNSDFGRVNGKFRDAYLTAVTRRSTVVILGDARNNGRPPNEQSLDEVARLAKRVIWMTPEPRWGWSLGGCDMRLYEPLCERVDVVRTAEQLAGVAEALVHEHRSSLSSD